MKKGLLYRNEGKKLSKDNTAAVLHPKYTGPSALEQYARCPFAYFSRHGLKPEEPVDFSVSRRNIGDIHHEILMRLCNYLSSDGKAVRDESSLWMTVSEDAVKAKVLEIAKQIADEDTSGLYKKGGEEEYRIKRVCDTASRFALEMLSQVRSGNIDKIECEKEFTLPFGNTTIKGKIDRVDTTKLSDEELVKVVDYKSGSVTFNKELIEKGLAIQLMIYLESESRDGEKPVGSFYFHISEPEFKTDSMSIMLSELSEAGVQKIKESFKLDGAYTDSPEALASLDKYIGPDGKSKILKKNQMMSEADFEKLRAAFREKLSENIEALSKGDVSVKPKKLGTNFTSCTWCDYKSVCAFDRQNEGFRYE
ncbi:MAG: PD-(D/E)XK nuclease family protein, partial [Firmicutes bacterium]|nr:PD-(D/E)XK nuclease family protein [Bacillota bacterium]